MSDIVAITMPRWGLTMEEGTVTEWMAEPGATIEKGAEIVEIETSKLSGPVESPASGVLRRQIAEVGQELPCGSLLGVLADPSVSDDAVDAFVDTFVIVETDDEEQQEAGPQVIDVDGATISYLRKGEGPPLLLIHGFGGSAAGWAFIQDSLAGQRDTIALDLPGHGASTKHVADGSLAGQADLVARFIAALGLDKVDVIAHSMGGGVALSLASARPDLVGTMVLIAPMGLGNSINSSYLEQFTAAEKQRDISKALTELFVDAALVSRQMVDEIQRFKRVDGVREALQVIACAIAPGGNQGADLAPVLASHPGRISVIWGQEDRIIPADQAPPGHSTVIPGVGHMPQAEAAAKVVEITKEALGS